MLLYNHSKGRGNEEAPTRKNKMGRNQIAEVITMTTNSSSVRFTLNFVAKTIVGTKASFTKAGKGFGPAYDELVALMANQMLY